MIYIEKDNFNCSLFKVESIGGEYYGWSIDSPDGWSGSDFNLYPNTDSFIQELLAPSILDRW